MYQGDLSMVTKGPFALFYGWDEIIPQLSEDFPDWGIPILTFVSVTFLVCLYLFKYLKSRKLNMYAHNLRTIMVENVLNMYEIVVIILISITGIVYGAIHFWGIKNNKNKEKITKSVPDEIRIMFMLTVFVIILPFIKSFALRYLVK